MDVAQAGASPIDWILVPPHVLEKRANKPLVDAIRQVLTLGEHEMIASAHHERLFEAVKHSGEVLRNRARSARLQPPRRGAYRQSPPELSVMPE